MYVQKMIEALFQRFPSFQKVGAGAYKPGKAFSYCQNLRSVKIPSNVTSIGNGAFQCCWYLDIVIDNSKDNVKVGEDVFGGCKSVTWLKE